MLAGFIFFCKERFYSFLEPFIFSYVIRIETVKMKLLWTALVDLNKGCVGA